VNVTGGSYLSEYAIAEVIRQELPSLRIRVVEESDTFADGNIGPLDLERASALLGYEPQVPFESRLRDFVRSAAELASTRVSIAQPG
jgi:nucleoside-diphosphate-sugar epimerase